LFDLMTVCLERNVFYDLAAQQQSEVNVNQRLNVYGRSLSAKQAKWQIRRTRTKSVNSTGFKKHSESKRVQLTSKEG